jgi:hypothetical protein
LAWKRKNKAGKQLKTLKSAYLYPPWSSYNRKVYIGGVRDEEYE